VIIDLSLPEATSRRQAVIVGFTSPVGGIGRTGVVANLAWIISSAGKRVLILDWSTEAPHVHEYLRPFYAESLPVGAILGEELLRMLAPLPAPEVSGRTPAQSGAPASLKAREYRLQTEGCRIDVVSPTGSIGLIGRFPQQQEAAESVRLGEQIRSAGYDYVLIDNPTDVSTAMLKRTAFLSDVVAMCFNPRYNTTVKAAELARSIRDLAPVSLRLLVVAVQFDDQDRHRAQQTLSRIRIAFADLLTRSDVRDERDLPDDVVKIPYQPYDALFDEALAVLLDEPGQERSLLSAYEGLASAITQGIVDRLRPVPPHIRARYRYALGLGPLDAQARVFLAYAPEDRFWADWASDQLERSGTQVARLPQDDTWLNESLRPSVIVLASAYLNQSQAGERATHIALHAQEDSGFADRFDLVVVQVSEEPVAEPLTSAVPISFLHCDDDQARTRLLYRFVLIDRPGIGRQSWMARFPAGPGPTRSRSKLPPRNPEFIGRGEEFEAMRDRFRTAEGICDWTLSGAAGVGKSEIAREYAHRFTLDYDLQWWIPARNRRSVRDSLTELAEEMKLPAGRDRPQAVLDALADGHPYARWLLVYDNLVDIGVLAGLRPASGAGHVIITTRAPAASAPTMATGEINPFQSNDSVALLRDQVPDLSEQDAKKVAALVEHMPLSLRLAAAWIRESAVLMRREVRAGKVLPRAEAAEWAAAEFCARVDRQMMQQPAGQSQGSAPVSLAAALGVVTETLRKDDSGRLVLRLSQLCAFLSADGVALRLLRSTSMLTALASAVADGDALALDPLELDQVLQSGSRSGLVDVVWKHPASLKMHRVVQTLVRDVMTPEEHQARHREVLRGLAAFAPTDADGNIQQDRHDFAELQKHLEPSGAATSDEISVRRWIVNHVDYLYRKRDPEACQFAVELSNLVLTGWKPGSRVETSLRMRLKFHLANLHRELGRDPETILRQDQDLLEEQRAELGPTHPRTLKTGRSRGADLRSLGRFAEACGEEQTTLQGFREVLGDDHPDTLRAANNLALSFFLSGDIPTALALERRNQARRLALFGPDNPDVWRSTCNVGIYLRELGRYEDALKVLTDSLAHIIQLRHPGHSDEMRIQWNRAITMRCSDDVTGALELNTETLRGYRVLFGEDHPRTRACKLSFALDHHQIGDSATAVRLAEDCLQDYVHHLGADHPFTALCRVDLAVFLRSLGEVERAFKLGSVSRDDLRNRLSEEHPWALAATINHAHGVAQAQDIESATELLRSAYDMCREFMVRDHPYTLLAKRNLSFSDIDRWVDVGVDLPET